METAENGRLERDYDRVAAAIRYLDDHARRQPEVDELAAAVGLSPAHFHRLFRRWAGITPKRFLQLLTLEEAKRRLDASRSVLHAAFEAGLSGPGRLHDLFVTLEGVTPGEYRTGGAGVDLTWGMAETPFGPGFFGRTGRGLCRLTFLQPEAGPEAGAEARAKAAAEAAALAELARDWPEARLRRDDAMARDVGARIFGGERLPVHVRGTNFQVRVWEALLGIPEGTVASYEDVARGLGRPAATRAVGSAIARNRIGFVIPCHRVIRKVGEAGGYRWGTARKRAMLAWEAARSE